MKIEPSLIDHKRKKTTEIPKESKKNKAKKRKNKKEMVNVVQKLYETCKEVFAKGEAGLIPPTADIKRLQLILDSMKPEDVNLAPNMPFFMGPENEEAPPLTYVHLYQCEKFTIGIFCLPPSGIIPLHDHPGMTVFSKLLFGTMHVNSYDWVTDIPTNMNDSATSLGNRKNPGKLAKVHFDCDFTEACSSFILYPAAGGNMHCFRALTPCAVLDVQAPPYSEPEGRPCTYYHDHPYAQHSELLSEEDGKGYAWLEEREQPEDFVVVGGMYDGPEIVEN